MLEMDRLQLWLDSIDSENVGHWIAKFLIRNDIFLSCFEQTGLNFVALILKMQVMN